MSVFDSWTGGKWLYCIACGFDIWSDDGHTVPAHDWEHKQRRFDLCRSPQDCPEQVQKFVRAERARRDWADYERINDYVRKVRAGGRP